MRKSPDKRGFFVSKTGSADFSHVRSLRSFLSLYDLELDFVALGERLESGATDRAEMDKDVRATLSRNEAKSLGVVEPFDRSSDACH
jgi:hypothetical protein